MSEETKTQKVHRGIATARGTQRLKFSHEHAKANGLFLAKIDKVEVTEILIGESTTGMPSFNGMKIPRLNISFASVEPDSKSPSKYINLSFTAVESNVDTIPGGKSDWKVNAIFDWLKHILDIYVLKGRELSDEEAASLSLTFDDTDEEGNYVSVNTEDVIAGYKTLFDNFAAIMNTGKDGNPVFKSADGKDIPLWIKLIRYTKNKKGWQAVNNGELAFPTFVGEGCIEIFRQNVNPSIRLNVIKECITPKEEEKPKTPNFNPMGGINPMSTGVPAGGNLAPFDNIGLEAAGDNPF